MVRTFHSIWRSILWVCLLILALNIESVATALGINNVLVVDANFGQRFMSGILDFLQSTPVLYATVFFLGGSVFAWGYSLFQRLEKTAGKPSLWKTANDCSAVSNVMRWYPFARWLGNVEKFIDRTNQKLAAFGIPQVSVHDLNNVDERILVGAYFRAVGSLIEVKDLDGARMLWPTVYERRLSSFQKSQLPSNTGESTPP